MSVSEPGAGSTAHEPLPALSYDRILNVLAAAWFFTLATGAAVGLALSPHMSWTSRTSGALLAVFYTLVTLLIVSRPPAKAKAEGFLPKTAAFIGAYMIWGVSFFGKTSDPTLNVLSSVLLLIGAVMMLVTLRHLGRAYSITPQARHVVQTGPYRWIRHPLYLWEEFAVVSVVLQSLSPATLIILFAHLGVQICRIRYEEGLLTRTFPAYATYAASTWRLVPYIW